MLNSISEYSSFKRDFENGKIKIDPSTYIGALKEKIKAFILTFIERKEVDIWLVKDECEFALITSYYQLDPKLHLPKDLSYPAHLYFRETGTGNEFSVVLLDHVIQELGGLEKAHEILQRKPVGACGYTTNLHRYRGYVFSNEWYEAEKFKPVHERICPYITINDLRKAVVFFKSKE